VITILRAHPDERYGRQRSECEICKRSHMFAPPKS
jgi:hypothetical protein